MLRLLLVAILVMAGPVYAQNESVCRGKTKFDLEDGAHGCVLSTVKSGDLPQPVGAVCQRLWGNGEDLPK